MMFLGGLPDSLNLQVAAEEALCANPKKAGLCNHQHLLPALYREALSRARRDQMGKHHFPSSPEHHIGPPIDYSTDAIIYVTVVIIFYAIIIVLLLIPKRSGSRQRATSESGSSGSSARKHWLFFNPISGEAQQATRKESAHFIHRQDAETV
ncbi:unnamed protein product [Allacma fusca]|uniref:Uncharacterized protein n=1 Tax=Allacma fusca TaxID=39272 RepID=A0A8J2JFD9_9HEXA|nr:unnamed protein product [Allacma fusca]